MSNDLRDSEPDSVHHVAHVAQMLETVISHVQGDLKKMADTRAVALFESALDVLTNLKTGFDEFQGHWGPQANPVADPMAQPRPTDVPLPPSNQPLHATEVHKAAGPKQPTAEAAHARAAPASPEVSSFDA